MTTPQQEHFSPIASGVIGSGPAMKIKNAELSLPQSIKKDAIYAITISQAESYDVGNIDFIPHYVLLDRSTGVAIDTTALISQAPLLSAVSEGRVLSKDESKQLDACLTGETIPQFSEGFPQGVNQFSAVEIPEEAVEALRSAMSQVAKAREAYDSAVRGFTEEVNGIRQLFKDRR